MVTYGQIGPLSGDLEAKLRLVVDFAPKLRAAGVASLTVDGVTMALVDVAPPAADATPDAPAPEPAAEDDPETYGRPPGSRPPGFTRPEDLE